MKKTVNIIISGIALALSAMGLSVACSAETAEAEHTITLRPDTLEFRYNDNWIKKVEVSRTPTDLEWSFEADGDWLNLARNANILGVSMKGLNTDEKEDREALVFITAGDARDTVVVIQRSRKETISVNPGELTFSAAPEGSQRVDVTIKEGLEWSVSKSEDADWLNYTMVNDSENFDNHIEVSAAANTGTQRSATLTVSATFAQDVEVIIVQEGA